MHMMYTISSTLVSGHDNLAKLLHYILHNSSVLGGGVSPIICEVY